MKRSLIAFACVLIATIAPLAFADDGDGPDLSSRIERYRVAYVLNPDATFTETRERALTVLKERMVGAAKHASVTYSTSIQKAEVLEAYTQKRDGRRLDVPKDNYQVETNSGREKGGPVFSDQTTLSVVFPDVEVGDTVVFSYRLTATEPLFPRHFSVLEHFSKAVAYKDASLRIDAPASLWAQYKANGLKEVANVEKDGRKILEWTFENLNPAKNKRQDYSVFDVEKEPGVAYSTFRTYADIAQAYGERATPKAAVSERIRKLADEIAGDKKQPRDVARALYDWTAINITYAGNCIGLGAVVPHDIDFILDNRMGDCKDHATLLQALLAAKGIDSVQALVNAGSTYRLTSVPVVSMVNHVINYIPSLDLFVDSTASTIPFGMLPTSDVGKPVLLVQGYRDGLRTPVPPVGANRQELKTKVTVRPDGSMVGETQVAVTGNFAVGVRARMRHIRKDTEENMVRDLYKNQGLIATGTFEKDDPTELTDRYRYGAKFDIKQMIQYPGAGAFGIHPLFLNEVPIANLVGNALEVDEEPVETACFSGYSAEEYTYVLPKGMKILYVPPNASYSTSFVSYKATYQLKGNVLTVRRILDDRTPGYICSHKTNLEYQAFARKVAPNLKAQVLYR